MGRNLQIIRQGIAIGVRVIGIGAVLKFLKISEAITIPIKANITRVARIEAMS